MSTPEVAIINELGGNLFKNCTRRQFHVKVIVILKRLTTNYQLKPAPDIKTLIDSTLKGMLSGNNPVRSLEGSGGVYLMRNVQGDKYVSVFKPIEEEPKALKKGIETGGGAVREVAAYILDRGFAGVPPTALVTLNNKIGSLQMYAENDGSCEDMGPAGFPVRDVHRLAVLDMRLVNADRHAGNILVRKDGDKVVGLVPIDHGYCFPDTFEDCTFEWLYWPQARVPFAEDVVEFVDKLDAEEDVRELRANGWAFRSECARVLRVATMLLKKGVKKGMTPFAIGRLMCRETVDRESVVESIVKEADCDDDVAFMESVSNIMDRYLEEVVI